MSSVATSFGRYWGASLVHSTRYSGLCRTVVRSSDEQTRLFWQATLRSGSSMMALAISLCVKVWSVGVLGNRVPVIVCGNSR